MGLSQYHDANFLNMLAQAGSNLGNFIYIDPSQGDLKTSINNALEDNLSTALNAAAKPKLTIILPSRALNDTKVCEVTHQYEEVKVEEDPDQVEVIDSAADNEYLDLTKKSIGIKYHCSVVLEESALLDPNFAIQLQINRELELKGKC